MFVRYFPLLAALFLAVPASAQTIDLKGKMVLIGATTVVQGEAPKREEFVLEGIAGIYIWWLNDGYCIINNIRGGLSVEYGPQARRSDSVTCDPRIHGTASAGSRDDRSFSFTSNFSQNGNTLTFSGEANSIHTITSRTTTSRGLSTDTAVLSHITRQSMTIRINGDSCEVVALVVDKTGTEALTADGTTRNGVLPRETSSSAGRTDCRVIPKSQYQGQPLVSAKRRGQ